MGSACCVAAKDRTITNGSSSDVMPGNARYSPSWSFQWENRGRVAGEETSLHCYSGGIHTNDRLVNKSHTTIETAYASEEGSPLETSQNLTWQKSPPSEGDVVSHSDPLNSKIPLEVPRGTLLASPFSPTKMSPYTHSVSSVSASPLSSCQGHLLPPSRWPRQVSDRQTPGMKSPNFSISEEGSPYVVPGWSNESNKGSCGGSSDSWSLPVFSDLMATSRRERWSFDSESLNFSRDKLSRSSGRVSSSPSVDIRTCGVCSKLLTEKSSWGSQKFVASNDLAVVAILICGHAYHAECLENMTPEINKYDPACPVCTLGEKQTFKLSEKALRAEMDLKAKINKKLRNRVVDGELVLFDRHRSHMHEGKGPVMCSSSSVKGSTGKPFLRRHFSFGSKGGNNSSRRKGFFWTKSSKE